MALCFFLIGLPGSGKSTLAQRLLATEGDRRLLATDTVRAQCFGDEATQGPWPVVWREVERQVQQVYGAIVAGQASALIYDATNVRRRSRREALMLLQQTGFTQILGLWLDEPIAVCLARNRGRQRQVPPAVIHQMQRQLRGAPPSSAEGFAVLYRWKGDRWETVPGTFGSTHLVPYPFPLAPMAK